MVTSRPNPSHLGHCWGKQWCSRRCISFASKQPRNWREVSAASLGNPLFLIKARMQVCTFSLLSELLFSHDLTGVFGCLPSRYTAPLPQWFSCTFNYLQSWRLPRLGSWHWCCHLTDSHGLLCMYQNHHFCNLPFSKRALWRDVQVQLPSYNFTKSQLAKHQILPADSTWTFLASSSVSGLCVVSAALNLTFLTRPRISDRTCTKTKCLVMQPADTVRTLALLILVQ